MRAKSALWVAAKLATLLFFSIAAVAAPAAAQDSDPDRDELLNGLRIIYLPQPGNGKVSLQLRIHSGAAFDPAGKSGVMALLGDSLFPEAESKNFFEELGGTLEFSTDYDAINVTMTGNANEVDRMLDALRSALVDPPLTEEVFQRLRAERVAQAKTATPDQIADQLVAERLLGQFPYGRPVGGTPETLAKIDRFDLNFARERFLNPNNATLVIGGTFDKTRVTRFLRQSLGAWRKSDRVIPSTFRQPDPPDARVLIAQGPGTEVRLALRGVARSDKDYPASVVLGILANDRLNAAKSGKFLRAEAHVLPGLVVIGGKVEGDGAGTALGALWDQAVKPMIDAAPSTADLDAAKTKAKALLNARNGNAAGAGGLWLDADTFKTESPAKQLRAVDAVTAADVQRVAVRLFKDAPVARVALGDPAALKTAVERSGFTTEMPGPVPAAPSATPAKTSADTKKP
jgi:zinc protease